MGDYFETDYVKDYDGALVRRILTYLKPQAPLVALVFIALAVTTASELAVPLLQQRLIDRHIIARYIALNLAAADTAAADIAVSGAAEAARLTEKTRLELEALQKKGGVLLFPRLFVCEDSRLHISGAAEKELREKGVLSVCPKDVLKDTN
jgi:ABC-type multidrug transport system fused ATPase/permease subunit